MYQASQGTKRRNYISRAIYISLTFMSITMFDIVFLQQSQLSIGPIILILTQRRSPSANSNDFVVTSSVYCTSVTLTRSAEIDYTKLWKSLTMSGSELITVSPRDLSVILSSSMRLPYGQSVLALSIRFPCSLGRCTRRRSGKDSPPIQSTSRLHCNLRLRRWHSYISSLVQSPWK
jgi:hypothetical protein